jgi:glycosyltransferase involved in cell wall biosynthesis
MRDCFQMADFWKQTLNATGQFEAKEIVMNAESLQKTWARENKISFNAQNWIKEILMAQIEAFKPEVVFLYNDEPCFRGEDASLRKEIRKNFPFIKVMIGWDGIARNNTDSFQGVDIVLSCIDFVVDFYKDAGFQSYLFPFGFDKSILKKLKTPTSKYDVSFVGGVNPYAGGHLKRLQLLDQLSRHLDLDLFIGGMQSTKASFYRKMLYLIKNGQFSNLNKWLRLKSRNRNEVYGLEMYQVMADSKITINTHIDQAKNKAANIRLFEATGAGTCLLTDWKENLQDYFKIDEEVVAYKSSEECIEKANYLLKNEAERVKIAKAGQKRTLEEYSYENRIMEFLPNLTGNI